MRRSAWIGSERYKNKQRRTEARPALWRLSENPEGFPTKDLQSAARIICVPAAHKFHTFSLRSIFSHAHVARENDFTFFAACGRQTLRGFFDKLSARTEIRAGGFYMVQKQEPSPRNRATANAENAR